MSDQTTAPTLLRVCPDCGLVCHLPMARAGYDIECTRCGYAFARTRQHSVPWMLACTLSGLIFYVTVLTAPFLEVVLYGRVRVSNMDTGIAALNDQGMWGLAAVIILTAVIMPLLKLSGLLMVFGALHLKNPPKWIVPLFRDLKFINSWSMVEIYLLGAVVAYTRLRALAHVDIDTAVFALIGMVLSMIAVDAILDPEAVWEDMEEKGLTQRAKTEPHHDVVGCECCHQANESDAQTCTRCGGPLHHRKPQSISKTWALVLASAIFYIPANLFPIMQVTRLERPHTYTIFKGVEEFIQAGLWPLALLVFVASVVIPMIKLISLVVMLIMTHSKSPFFLLVRTRTYRFIDFIGRWSMIDIFMLSILVGLMQFGALAQIRPQPGAVYFTAVIILTMFAVGSFDPRLMWDAVPRNKRLPENAVGEHA